MKKEIEIETTFGTLVAQVGADPAYPEIYLFLRKQDGLEINLCCVTDESVLKGCDMLRIAVWNRPDSEDYHYWADITREEIENVR